MKTKQVDRKEHICVHSGRISLHGAGAHRLSVYRDGVQSDDTGKRLQLLVGNAHEPGDLCGQRTVSGSQLLRAERHLFNVIFMEFMVNIRHIFYGLSLLERFPRWGKSGST